MIWLWLCNSLTILSVNVIILRLFGVSPTQLDYRRKSTRQHDLNTGHVFHMQQAYLTLIRTKSVCGQRAASLDGWLRSIQCQTGRRRGGRAAAGRRTRIGTDSPIRRKTGRPQTCRRRRDCCGVFGRCCRSRDAAVTGQLADTPSRGLDDSRTGQLADATGDFACLVYVLLAASAIYRELSSPRLVQSASWRIRELSMQLPMPPP